MGSSGHAHGGSYTNLDNMTPEERKAYLQQQVQKELYEKKKRNRRIAIGVVIGIVIFIVLIILMVQCTKNIVK